MYTRNDTGNSLIRVTVAAATIACSTLSTTAPAAEPSWYAGVGLGRVFADHNVSDFDDGSISGGSVDPHDSGRKLTLGYRFSDTFAIEGGYVDLNNDVDEEATFTGTSDGTGGRYAAGGVSVDIDEPVGAFAVALGSVPLADRVVLNARLGALAWQADETTRDANGKRTRELDGTGAVWGVGLEYRCANNLALRGDWEAFQNLADEDYDFLSLSALYYFR